MAKFFTKSIPTPGRVGISRWICFLEPTFVTETNEMIRVDGLDISGDLGCPGVNGRSSRIAVLGCSTSRSSAPWFVGELPSHNGRFILVASDPCSNILLES